jgi:hypothetical protein
MAASRNMTDSSPVLYMFWIFEKTYKYVRTGIDKYFNAFSLR